MIIFANLIPPSPPRTDDITRLSKLERITLEGNRVAAIDWTSFVRLDNLQMVKLWRGNPIECACNLLELQRFELQSYELFC